jgi:hypothetical protein
LKSEIHGREDYIRQKTKIRKNRNDMIPPLKSLPRLGGGARGM